MNEGWFKIHRCLFKKVIWLKSTPEQKVILITLLGMANHEECEWEWNGKQFKAKPGEFITSANSIMNKSGLGISRQNVRTALARFQKYEFLTYESTKTGIFVNIVNWGLYQGERTEINQDFNQGVTNESPRGNQRLTNMSPRANQMVTNASPRTNQGLTTNKKDKNDKKDKNININNISELTHIDNQNNKNIFDYECENEPQKHYENGYKKTNQNGNERTNEYGHKEANEYTELKEENETIDDKRFKEYSGNYKYTCFKENKENKENDKYTCFKQDKESDEYTLCEEIKDNQEYTNFEKNKENNDYTRFEDINYIYQNHECIDRNVKNIKSSKYNKNTNKYRYMNEFTRNKLLIETIIDFMKMRDEIKKPMTDRALQLMLRKLRNLSLDEQIQIKILENSIENCWQGIFPLRDGHNGINRTVQLEEDISRVFAKNSNRAFILKEGKYGGVRKNIGPSEKKFNIKIPRWTPSSDGEFKDQNIGGKFEGGNEAEPF
ncbi:hypothetical protein [Clostridium saccharobutylicum]|uniref:DNA replication protein DnaD n=1 Tax=Clostridium saccharobutylicum TaxID=169679 RepID=A0A1S8NHD0_CLOSA|nr:hypothetical protein [Clostridium saccharobutylicum]OOM15906.1 hypothetical protein CLOSAC_01770 [Clostridium saccharobutylicum]